MLASILTFVNYSICRPLLSLLSVDLYFSISDILLLLMTMTSKLAGQD